MTGEIEARAFIADARRRITGLTAQHGADAGQHFTDIEWLLHAIVRADIETAHARFGVVA